MSTSIAPYTGEQQQSAFNPHEHLIQIPNKGGKADYLPVQWRLVWFRELCPTGTINTEELEVSLDRECEAEVSVWNQDTRRSEKTLKIAKGYARFRATVTDGKGGRATATKTERAVDFPDYVEKAETGAVGRALAMLGYGTQFIGDDLNEEHRIVDAPVEKRQPSEQEREKYQQRKPFVEGSVAENPKPGIPGSSDGDAGVPTVKALQERCAALCGTGYWQAMVLKALKREEPIRERDLLTEHRAKIAAYLDFVEQQKARGTPFVRPSTDGQTQRTNEQPAA